MEDPTDHGLGGVDSALLPALQIGAAAGRHGVRREVRVKITPAPLHARAAGLPDPLGKAAVRGRAAIVQRLTGDPVVGADLRDRQEIITALRCRRLFGHVGIIP